MIILVEDTNPKFKIAGGTERYTINLYNYLINKNKSVLLLGSSEVENQISHNFIPIITNNQVNGIPGFISLNLNFLYKLRLIKIPIPQYLIGLFFWVFKLKLTDKDVIHVQRIDYLLPFIFYKVKGKKICTLHWNSLDSIRFKNSVFIAFIYKIIEDICLKKVDKIIVMNKSIESYYLNNYPYLKDKIYVSTSSVDTEKFYPYEQEKIIKLKEQYGFNKFNKIIIFIGRLEKEKNIDLLLYSFSLLNNEKENIKLVLVGDGREKIEIINLIKKIGLRNVYLMGNFSSEKVVEILNCSDLLVLTSKFEISPTVVKEALACSVPVVSVDVGDVKDILISEDIGMIVEPDKYQISQAMEKCLNIKNNQNFKDVCKIISNKYDTFHIFENIMKIYDGDRS
jgi:glycosyltransferase involved in cell wall biosynthesis